ncbi:hypothetical protein [Methylococcus sp. EFPC2]|uniref:hypothetical protein n=1 Tax=Methylococcus sp. EFPC2 TaxID=2812648 RepID=UPI001967F306|nr:hypothetical protein [Methylococcus sp. EFPC2]QSA98814.1 hypothetical protein JWZ97_08570 [Methylococcus sp. EFPC2]
MIYTSKDVHITVLLSLNTVFTAADEGDRRNARDYLEDVPLILRRAPDPDKYVDVVHHVKAGLRAQSPDELRTACKYAFLEAWELGPLPKTYIKSHISQSTHNLLRWWGVVV